MVVSTLALFALTGYNVAARCGETLDQAKNRFGAVVQEYPDSMGIGQTIRVFRMGNFHISAIFEKDVIVAESYTKDDGIAYTDPEEKPLLDAEAAGQTWKPYSGLKFDHAWVRDDGAMALVTQNKMVFVTRSYLEKAISQKESKDSLFHF